MATFVLVHSPYAGPLTWHPVGARLRALGHEVRMPSFAGLTAGGPPFWPRAVETVVADAAAFDGIVLVGHSGVGPLLPLIGAELGDVQSYLFVDATLPVQGYCRADSITPQERTSPEFATALERGEVPNPWRSPETWRYVGISDEARARELAADSPPIPTAMDEERVSLPGSWPDAQVAFLAFVPNPFYAPMVEQARSRGWAVSEMEGSHFHMLIDAAAVARAIIELGTSHVAVSRAARP